VLLLLESGRDRVHRSEDEGKTWSVVKELEDVKQVILHPFSKETRAYAMTSGKTHYWTKDKGKSWTKFSTEYPAALDDGKGGLSFNAAEPDWVIFKGQKCKKEKEWFDQCQDEAFYTTNNFDSIKPLLSFVGDCVWGRSSAAFTDGAKELIFCTEWPQNNDEIIRSPERVKLVKSTNFFEKDSKESVDIGGGVLGLGVVQKFMVAAVKPKRSQKVDMYLSVDGTTFRQALLPGDYGIQADEAYTVLESSDHRLTIDVLASSTSKKATRYGNLFFSSSNGTYFTHSLPYTNRDMEGRVDFERIQTSRFSGLILANTVSNWKDLEKGKYEEKKIVTKLSWDDGAHWNLLRPPVKDAEGNEWHCKVSDKPNQDCALHLHSVTTTSNIGRVFSSNAAPGFIIGVGSVGRELLPYDSCHTFLSTDGGRTWVNTAKGPHKYETADMGSVIVLVPDNGPTDHILYSTKRGEPGSYKKIEVKPNGVKQWKPRLTDIDPDSSSNKMIIFLTDAADTSKNFVAHVDLSNVQSKKCGSADFENWSPAIDGNAACMMGEILTFKRRKADAACSVGRKFKEPEVSTITCECSEMDYECDFNFKPTNIEADSKFQCEPAGALTDQPEGCKKGTKYLGSSGYSKIPGNKCKNGKRLDEKVYRECKENNNSGGGQKGKPAIASKSFDGTVEKIVYMRKSQTVFFMTSSGAIWRSDDEGFSWSEPDVLRDSKPIKLIGLHDIDDKRLFFFNEADIFYSLDGQTTSSSLKKMETPAPYNGLGLPILDFHPTEKDYLVLLAGARGCPDLEKCFTEVYLSTDNGNSWLNAKKPVETWATKCVWAHDIGFGDKTSLAKDAVYCASYKYKNGKTTQEELGGRGTDENPLQLVLITNGGKDRRVLIDKGVVTFYVVESFFTVAVETSSGVKILVSVDGVNFAETVFPPNIKVEKNGFTVLESTTGAVFMDAVQNTHYNKEIGALFKSNSNGTFFSRILNNSNRNEKGQVDVEKVSGVPGVVMVNQVTNPTDVAAGSSKRIKTLISFDDGARWMRLSPPKKDSGGREYTCTSDCTLNLYRKTTHGQHSFGRGSVSTSPAAAGVVVGIGNVGPSLRSFEEGDMFLSLDAGRKWKEIHKNPHKWAIGDHGGVIVMASDKTSTDTVLYSYDYGTTWSEVTFASDPIMVHSILTLPDSTSLKFLILGFSELEKSDLKMTAYGLDFDKTLSRMCDKPSSSSSDFSWWSPLGDEDKDRCFMGKRTKFLRRKEGANCLIGKEFEDLTQDSTVCECTKDDFECDYNFWFDDDSKECVLLSSDPLQPANCKAGTKYQGSSGYRKIPLSSCKGGLNLEKTVERVCGEASKGPQEVKVSSSKFKEKLEDYFYFNRTKTAVILDASGQVWVSKDSGMSWDRPNEMKETKIVRIVQDQFRGSRAFFFTTDKKHFKTEDNGASFHSFETPSPPNIVGADLFSIHPDESKYLIYTGQSDCGPGENNCRAVSYVSRDTGGSWSEIRKYSQKCIWARDKDFKPLKDEIFCRAFEVESGNQRHMDRKDHPALFMSKDLGRTWERVFPDVVGFAISYEYMVAAVGNPEKSELHLMVTLDGINWKRGVFQDDSNVLETGYTLLESGTGSIFLEVFTSRKKDEEYGTLYKSNGEGVDFEIVQKNVNQDHAGYVDFEKMLAIDGIAITNVVANPLDVHMTGTKKIETLITYNDGARWQALTPPERDSNGNSYNCENNCRLNLHHFTERRDKNDLFSSKSAVGLMMGVGNVDRYLSKYTDGDTFITRDAGRTWKEVTKEAYMIEIGDRGGVIVMVYDEGPTDEIKYTLDQGNSVRTLSISDKLDGGKLRVSNIISEPYGSTSTFVVFGSIKGGNSDGSVISIHLDFENVWEQNCKFEKDREDVSDFESWSPTGEASGDEKCIFGEQKNYYRRKANRHCKIGEFFETPQIVKKSCACTADDFECDTGFMKNSTGGCAWEDSSIAIPAPTCINGLKMFTTGYRKHKKTKCQGGLTLDKGQSEYCASKISAFGWFGIILLSVGIPAAITYALVWHYRGGRIRLPVDSGSNSAPAHWAERVGQVLRTGLVFATEFAELVVSKCRGLYDWVRMRSNRHAGYSPVRNVATALDDEIDNDPALMDLDDY
ncbi:vacuolar protein sorting/targeting protein PEP1, partial [Dinochytrium kinnereticum]